MKAHLIAAALMLGTSGYARAADPMVEDVAIAASAHDWSGIYAGGLVGYGWSELETRMVRVGDVTSGWFGYDGNGVSAGAVVGANWQSGAFVFGVEGDVSIADIQGENEFRSISGQGPGGSFAFGRFPPFFDSPMDFTTTVEWYATIRGRLGYAVDRWFLYGTAGLAIGGIESTFFDPDVSPSRSGDSTTQVGYAVGAGAEAALTNEWSLRLEYLFIDLGDDNHKITTVFSGSEDDWSIDTDVQLHTVRTALVYKF